MARRNQNLTARDIVPRPEGRLRANRDLSAVPGSGEHLDRQGHEPKIQPPALKRTLIRLLTMETQHANLACCSNDARGLGAQDDRRWCARRA